MYRSSYQVFVASLIIALLSSVRLILADSSPDAVWTSLDAPPASKSATEQPWIRPDKYKLYQLDSGTLLTRLKNAPQESVAGIANPAALDFYLPTPDGSYARFRLVESPIMEDGLAQAYPDIKTYAGQGLDDPKATVRCDWTPQGFHASVLTPSGMWYVDPFWKNDPSTVSSYYRRDLRSKQPWQCLVDEQPKTQRLAQEAVQIQSSGGTLRTFRLACAATGEYTAFQGGTVPLGQAAIVTAVNRVNQVYEADFAIRMVLVANNSSLVYTNATTDPYTNDDPGSLLTENQSNVDSVIHTGNYDIGHVFSTAGGGLAELGVVCVSGFKAEGETGIDMPTGDAFYIDYVAHEMGHQFGANHCFNGVTSNCSGANRNASTAMEPGSGSTIMCYAGICGADDLQPHSDPYFHSISYDEIMAYVTTSGGGTCSVNSSTGNTPPTVNAGADYAIPEMTPFTLTASGSDANSDPLTYCWEERDLGAAQLVTAADNGASPIFRSFNPTSSSSRTFPQLSSIISGSLVLGEQYPSVARSAMKFRVTARDNRAGGGGINTDDMQLQVVGTAGPFRVTSPNTHVTWSGSQTVTWDVANTNVAPINTSSVNILLSTDGGQTFPTTLKSGTPNDGSEVVTLPATTTDLARIRVEAVGNVYWDMSDANFSITSPGCTYAISSSGADFGPTGGEGTFSMTAGAGCGWTAVSDSPWVVISGGTSGTGFGTIQYIVVSNIGHARTAHITVTGSVYTVNQAAGVIPICPAPAVISDSITASDPVQPGRLNRALPASDCVSAKSCPGLIDSGARHYDSYTFINNTASAQCVTITLDETNCGNGLFAQTYMPSFDPSDLCANYLGDLGVSSNGSSSYTSSIPAGQTFVVVVNEVTPNAGCPGYTLQVAPESCSSAENFTQSVDEPFATNSTGWGQFGTTTGEQSTRYDGTRTALVATVGADAGSNWRIIGWLTDATNVMFYSSVGSNHFVRGKFYVYAAGQSGSAANQIPNFRLRVANRFAVTSLLVVNNHNSADPEGANLSQDIRPSTSPLAPSIYRVDLDPIDVPQLANNPTTEGFLRAFEIYEPDPQANGDIGVAESVLGTYPALADSSSIVPVTQNGLVKEYLPGTSDGGDFGTGNIGSSNSSVTSAKYHNGALEGTGPQPTYSVGSGGVTMATLSVESDRLAVIAWDVFNDIGDQTNHLTRARVEPLKQYKVRFHATSTKASNTQSLVRFRARTIKFQYTASMEVGGATGASVQSNSIAAQALPGVGNQIPTFDRISPTENGGWYNVLMVSPMSSDIQPNQPLLNAQDGPGVDTLPGGNTKSRRDLQFGFDVIDTFSAQPTSGIEAGLMTVDQVQIEKYGLVPD